MAVALFLQHKIGYLDIARLIAWSMEHHHVIKDPSLEEILAVEKDVYRLLKEKIKA